MKFIESIPSDLKKIGENRCQYFEKLYENAHSLIEREDILQAYPVFLNLISEAYQGVRLLSKAFDEKLKELYRIFLEIIQNGINSNAQEDNYRIYVLIKFIGQLRFDSLDKSEPLPKIISKFEKRIINLEEDIRSFNGLLKEDEITEIRFVKSYVETVISKAKSSNIVDMGSATQDLSIKFYDYITTTPKIYDKPQIATISMNLSTDLLELGKVDNAKKIGKFGLRLAEEVGVLSMINGCLQMVGNCYRHQGKLDQALIYYEKMINNDGLPYTSYAYPVRFIGYILETQGEIDEALKYYQTSLNLFKFIGYKIPMARTLQSIAHIYFLKANFKTALEFSRESLRINEGARIKNHRFTVDLLYHQVLILLEQNNVESANEYFNEITELHNKFSNLIIDQQYQLTKALILKRSKRIRHKAEAQNILEQIANGPVLNHEYTIVAM